MTDEEQRQHRAEAFEACRDRLFAIAYRMLGSAADAEDIVQETSLRWLEVDGEAVRSPEAYLTKAVTHLSINHLRSAQQQRETYVGPWLPEPIDTGAARGPAHRAELADSLSMAFLRLLETLTPTQRAVFLLREVFKLGYDEIAEVIGKTEVNCRQLAHRARKRVRDGRPRFDVTKEEQERLMGRFQKAVDAGDLAPLKKMLAEDVTLYSDGGGKVRAVRQPVYGADRVARFIRDLSRIWAAALELEQRPAEINGEPGFLVLQKGEPRYVWSFHLEAGRIRDIFVVSNPEKLRVLNTQVKAS